MPRPGCGGRARFPAGLGGSMHACTADLTLSRLLPLPATQSKAGPWACVQQDRPSNGFTTDGSTPTRIGFRHSSFFYMPHEISSRIFRWVKQFKYSNAKPNSFFDIQNPTGFWIQIGTLFCGKVSAACQLPPQLMFKRILFIRSRDI